MGAAAVIAFDGFEVPVSAARLDGFRAWVSTLDEQGPRVSFCAGRVFVEMSPQSYRSHGPLVTAINRTLGSMTTDRDLGMYCTPPSWLTHEATGLSTEPDGFLVLWSSFESGQARLNPERETEMLGRPDLVLEVVSRSSERKDLIEHVRGYASAGVPEYWIADARADLVFRILVLEQGVYRDQVASDGWLASPLLGGWFRLLGLTNRAGLPDFRLEVRA
jgi:Uma2 family endonuclease